MAGSLARRQRGGGEDQWHPTKPYLVTLNPSTGRIFQRRPILDSRSAFPAVHTRRGWSLASNAQLATAAPPPLAAAMFLSRLLQRKREEAYQVVRHDLEDVNEPRDQAASSLGDDDSVPADSLTAAGDI